VCATILTVHRSTVFRIALTVLMAAGVKAYERGPDLRAVAEAIAIGQARDDAVRLRFHQPYRIPVGRPPIDYIDVVTPFRRVELAAEEWAQSGERVFRQRDALTLLAEHGDTLKLFLEATFHPQNTYIGVPAYAVTLARTDMPEKIEPRDQQPIPRFGLRMNMGRPHLPYPLPPSLPSGGEPLVGATVIVTFDGQRLDPSTTYEAVIEESRKELARVRIDLGKLR
jgi:hypothetical protein